MTDSVVRVPAHSMGEKRPKRGRPCRGGRTSRAIPSKRKGREVAPAAFNCLAVAVAYSAAG
ncbi:hypothetical protein J8J27_25820, partial [Mycobacterium tuberculosis]|nr:hypothetical protein [Mycobacterium tuberculosis]